MFCMYILCVTRYISVRRKKMEEMDGNKNFT